MHQEAFSDQLRSLAQNCLWAMFGPKLALFTHNEVNAEISALVLRVAVTCLMSTHT